MSVTDRAWAATRKGLIELRRRNGSWAIAHTAFLGEPVSMLLPPAEIKGSGTPATGIRPIFIPMLMMKCVMKYIASPIP